MVYLKQMAIAVTETKTTNMQKESVITRPQVTRRSGFSVARKGSGFLDKVLKSFPLTTNAPRIANGWGTVKAKPFIQWVGGKREMIPQYESYIPKKINTYYEPFLGGGAMFFHLEPLPTVLADNNPELIKTYEGVRDNVQTVIDLLKIFKSKHSAELYSAIRNIDREINIFEDLTAAEVAARFIYLNQTGFNGLYRVNQKGQFNVPIGSSLDRTICDEVTLLNASRVLQQVELVCADFNEVLKNAKKNDFVYFDPPYYPVSIHSDFTRYTKEKFYQEDQVRLKETIDQLTAKGCKVMMSNSDCEFIRKLYSKYKKIKVQSSRTLNCKSDRRGKVTELLIINYSA